jgi:hypothetical protein
MDERALDCLPGQPLIGWRLFRVRPSSGGWVLSAPLIHDPHYEQYPSRVIEANCYQGEDHLAPAPGCRCGLYAAIQGTLDSLSGYLRDSAHDTAPPIYAEVACTGRVFLDARGVRAQRIEVLGLASSRDLWADPTEHDPAMTDLRRRYGVDVRGLEVVPRWLLANAMGRGAPPEDASVDLDALLERLGRRAVANPR